MPSTTFGETAPECGIEPHRIGLCEAADCRRAARKSLGRPWIVLESAGTASAGGTRR